MKKNLNCTQLIGLCNPLIWLWLFGCKFIRCDNAFISVPKFNNNQMFFSCCDNKATTFLSSTRNDGIGRDGFHDDDIKWQWEEFDNWSSLSSENESMDSSLLFNKDVISDVAKAIDNAHLQTEEKDIFLDEDLESIVDSIYMQTFEPNAPALYDTVFDDNVDKDSFELDAENEISMLVRCNESPDDLLISQGRALPPLTEQERYDYKQLVTIFSPDNGKNSAATNIQPTAFFRNAISEMFKRHSVHKHIDNDNEIVEMAVMDKDSVAQWLSTSLGEPTISKFDKRVTKIISQFGVYKSAVLTLQNFEQIYYTSVRKELLVNARGRTLHLSKNKSINKLSVWQDIENHGIDSPVVEERQRLYDEIEMKNKQTSHTNSNSNGKSQVFMDECEIVWGKNWDSKKKSGIDSTEDRFVNSQNAKSHNNYGTHHYQTQSHRLVDTAKDGKTPLRVRDGQFVFVDEESCIGCKQCVNVATSSFTMLESGRARCFEQDNIPEIQTAIAACPVNCIHSTTFDELKQLENARDNVDNLNEKFKESKIPLHVARRDSDSNRKSSVYHYLKSKCYLSKECPKRGCYECPNFDSPGANPYFQKNYREAEHIRALEIMESGEGDCWRNYADL